MTLNRLGPGRGIGLGHVAIPRDEVVPGTRASEIITAILAGPGGRSALPERLCQECAVTLTLSGVGLGLTSTVSPSGGQLVATTASTRQLEELQFTLGEGPCVDAAQTGSPVLEHDLLVTSPTRWPLFTAAAVAAGFRAIFAFPLHVGAIRLGSLTLYRDVPGRLTTFDLAEAWVYTDAATLMLLHLEDSTTAGTPHPALSADLDDRAQVHQATGMISVQLGVGLGDALLMLRANAYAVGRSIRDVSTDVVLRRIRFDDTEFDASGIR